MIQDDITTLLSLINRFVDGRDRSRRLADEIEGLVLESFVDEPWFDDVTLALAQFKPGGGESYLDEEALAFELRVPVSALRLKLD